MAPPDDRPRFDPPLVDQSWAEYRRLVLGELERQGKRIEETVSRNEAGIATLNQRIDILQGGQISEIRVELADLKARSGLFGGLMGAVTGLAVAIGSMLIGKH